MDMGETNGRNLFIKYNYKMIWEKLIYSDIFRHICEANYHFIITKNKSIVDEIREKHIVRFFFPQEIRHYLEENAFKLIKMCPFLNLNARPKENDWNVAAISKATPAPAILKVFQRP
jgi:hypothetical protein